MTYLKARKSDGSIAEITFAVYEPPGHVVVGVRKVQSMAERASAVVYFRSKVKSTLPLRDDELAAIKSGPADPSCRHHPERLGPVDFRGTDRFLGFAVVKHAFKSATATTELWESPDLNCEVLYMKTEFLDSKGEVTDATVKSAIEITRQEPEGWIFALDAGKDVPPSQAIAAENAAHGLATAPSEQPKFVR